MPLPPSRARDKGATVEKQTITAKQVLVIGGYVCRVIDLLELQSIELLKQANRIAALDRELSILSGNGGQS